VRQAKHPMSTESAAMLTEAKWGYNYLSSLGFDILLLPKMFFFLKLSCIWLVRLSKAFIIKKNFDTRLSQFTSLHIDIILFVEFKTSVLQWSKV
jgi:hypothetical protein